MTDTDTGWTATVHCPLCTWGAEVSGDTVEEVHAILERIAREHVRDRHGRRGEIIRSVEDHTP